MSAANEKARMLAGEMYDPQDAELVAMRSNARRLLAEYNRTAMEDGGQRRAILEQLLGAVGAGSWIEPPFFCDYGAFIELGDNVYMNFNCVILDCNRVRIGAQTMLGPGVHIYAATHPLNAVERTSGRELAAPVEIGSQVWIGGGAIICPNVKIGDRTTIGAGSVVTRDVPANVFAAGNPCRVIKEV